VAQNAIHGRFGGLYVDQSSGANGSPSQLGNLMDWTIGQDRDLVDVTVLGETNKSSVAGLAAYDASYNGVLDTASNAIFTVADGIKRNFYHYIDITDANSMKPVSGGGKGYWYGSQIFAGLTTNSGVSDAVKWAIKSGAGGNVYRV
jgi:hypothetical protein